MSKVKVCEISPCVGQYLKDIVPSQPLSSEEEGKLARRVKQGDRASRDKLIEANLRFVVSVAREYQGCGLPLAELIATGNNGLITAAERFNEKLGCRFISYAVYWIRQAILAALGENRAVRLPVNQIKVIVQRNKARVQLSNSLCRFATREELAEDIGWTPDVLDHLDRLSWGEFSLDTPIGRDGDKTVMELVPDTATRSPDEELSQKEVDEKLERALETLDSRSREVVELWCGLKHMNITASPRRPRGGAGHTLEEIGRHLGVTRERTRQIKEKALPQLRKALLSQGVSSSHRV